eukprot:1742004-Pyramimonas_sp.AAC.5
MPMRLPGTAWHARSCETSSVLSRPALSLMMAGMVRSAWQQTKPCHTCQLCASNHAARDIRSRNFLLSFQGIEPKTRTALHNYVSTARDLSPAVHFVLLQEHKPSCTAGQAGATLDQGQHCPPWRRPPWRAPSCQGCAARARPPPCP